MDGRPDAMIDSFIDAPADTTPFCLGKGVYQHCPGVTPRNDITFTSELVNTTSEGRCDYTWNANNGTPTCTIYGQNITIPAGATLRVDGTANFVLAASGTITVDGTIDASSSVNGQRGAGANPNRCIQGQLGDNGDGGPGGSFGTRGGSGGKGTAARRQSGAAESNPAASLRGGCGGGGGTDNSGGTQNPTYGGGAVYLVATGAIQIGGVINVSGAGARACPNNQCGGSGGGSGGYVGLDGNSITITGTILAHGGGGAEGSGFQNLGSAGTDPPLSGGSASGGRNGSTDGGDGGSGASQSQAGANGQDGSGFPTGGGGGGGGGVGVITSWGTVTSTGLVSPPLIRN